MNYITRIKPYLNTLKYKLKTISEMGNHPSRMVDLTNIGGILAV